MGVNKHLLKLSAVLCALSLLMLGVPSVSAEEEPSSSVTISAGGTATATATGEYYSSVLKTYSQNGYTDYAGERIAAVADESAPIGETVLGDAAYTGVLWSEETETVTFRVTVPEDALYNMGTVYYPLGTTGSDITRELVIDGKSPFRETANIEFLRFWKDANAPLTDKEGDEVKPFSKENPRFEDSLIFDSDGKYTAALKFYLTAGEHELTFRYIDEPLFIQSVYLSAPETLPSYAEVLAKWKSEGKTANGKTIEFEGESFEHVKEKTDSVIGVEHSGDPSASPSSPYVT